MISSLFHGVQTVSVTQPLSFPLVPQIVPVTKEKPLGVFKNFEGKKSVEKRYYIFKHGITLYPT